VHFLEIVEADPRRYVIGETKIQLCVGMSLQLILEIRYKNFALVAPKGSLRTLQGVEKATAVPRYSRQHLIHSISECTVSSRFFMIDSQTAPLVPLVAGRA
jgi:hypothetical protein